MQRRHAFIVLGVDVGTLVDKQLGYLNSGRKSGRMRIISFIEESKTIDRIIRHLKLTFEAERPPPPPHVQQDRVLTAEEMGEYF